MRLYAAGGTSAEYTEYCVRHKVPKLYSALAERSHIKAWIENPKTDQIPLMIDSGAFSWNKAYLYNNGIMPNNLPKAKDFAKKYLEFMAGFESTKNVQFVEFDVYNVLPIKTIDKMYQEAIKMGHEIIRVYHVDIDGGSFDQVLKWIDEGVTYIGAGHIGQEMWSKLFSITRDKIKVHGFAKVNKILLRKYPFYSVDSTSPLFVKMYRLYIDSRMRISQDEKLLASKSKRHKILVGAEARLEEAVKAFAWAQEYYTELWKRRGVVWEDQ